MNEENFSEKIESNTSETLVFLCCTTCYLPETQPIATDFLHILDIAGTGYKLLEEEACCGAPAFYVSEFGLFEILANKNIENINTTSTDKLITVSPHCYDIFVNEYSEINNDFKDINVISHSEFINSLRRKGLLEFDTLNEKISYFDPCTLRTKRGIHEPPRELINSIPGVSFEEVDENNDLCCGGGGGAIFREEEIIGDSEIIVERAKERNVDILVTSCPFCKIQLTDACKRTDIEREILDIAEICNRVLR